MIDEPTFTETIVPYLPFLGVVAGGIVVGIFAAWNRKRGNLESRAPNVNDAWEETNVARADLFFWQELFYTLRAVFKAYARRMIEKDPSNELTEVERSAIEADTTPPSARR